MVLEPVTAAMRRKRTVGVVFAVVGLVFATLIIVNPSSPAVGIMIPLMIIFVVLGAVLLVDVERSRRRGLSR